MKEYKIFDNSRFYSNLKKNSGDLPSDDFKSKLNNCIAKVYAKYNEVKFKNFPSFFTSFKRKYPDRYAKLSKFSFTRKREESFEKFPRIIKNLPNLSPSKMARAGFFYTGKWDAVFCFHCGEGAEQWDLDDDPMEEHKKHYPSCAYAASYTRVPDSETRCYIPKKNVLLDDENLKTFTEGSGVLFPPGTFLLSQYQTFPENKNEDPHKSSDTFTCSLCLDNEVDTVFLPCMHEFCHSCYENCVPMDTFNNQCPTCRTPIDKWALIDELSEKVVEQGLYTVTPHFHRAMMHFLKF